MGSIWLVIKDQALGSVPYFILPRESPPPPVGGNCKPRTVDVGPLLCTADFLWIPLEKQ